VSITFLLAFEWGRKTLKLLAVKIQVKKTRPLETEDGGPGKSGALLRLTAKQKHYCKSLGVSSVQEFGVADGLALFISANKTTQNKGILARQ